MRMSNARVLVFSSVACFLGFMAFGVALSYETPEETKKREEILKRVEERERLEAELRVLELRRKIGELKR